MAEKERHYIRITHLNVDGHKRVAVTHPRVEVVVELRETPEDEWKEVAKLDISSTIRDTRIESTTGEVTKLWLGIVAFDTQTETEETD